MAKSNPRAGWRKSNSRPVATTSNEFGSRGRENRKLLFRVSMLTTLAIMLLGLLAYVLIYSRPDRDVPLILSVVSGSSRRAGNEVLFTAPNPYAAEDVELLRAWFDGGKGHPSENVRIAGNPSESSGVIESQSGMLINAITKPLATVQPGGPGGDMIAVYLSAHGFVDNGVPYLAVSNSHAGDEQSWVRFNDLFAQINRTLDDRVDASTVKLVMFIDAARVGPQWDWGHFGESFSAACASVAASRSDRIAILLSASPGERSWWDPRLGQGLFTQAVVEALVGNGNLNNDRYITVGEVFQYVSNQVRESAAANWDASQTPMFVGKEAQDWVFISHVTPETPPAIDPVNVEKLKSDLDAVDQLWTRHNKLATNTHSPLTFDPLGWAVLEKKLSRLEAFLLAGKGYDDQYQELRSQCESELTQFENGPDSIPDEEAIPEYTLLQYFHAPETRSQIFQSMVETWNKKPDPKAVNVELDEYQAIGFLWPWVTEKGYDRQSLALVAEVLDSKNLVTSSRPALLLESHLARMLSANDLAHVTSSDTALITETLTKSRDVLCADDLRTAFWIRNRFREINQDRLEGVDKIFSIDPDDQAAGRDRLRRTVLPAFEQLSKSAVMISQAYKLRDQMLHSIPRIAETLMTELEAFDDQENHPDNQSRFVLQRCIDGLSELVRVLRVPDNNETRPIETLEAEIESAANKARREFAALTERITSRLNDAASSNAGDARALRQNRALLVGSGTNNAELRKRVHQRYCRLVADQSSGVGKPRAQFDEVTDSSESRVDYALMAVNRQHIWEYWLERSASPNTVAAEESESSPLSANSEELATLFQKTGGTFRGLVADLSSGKLTDHLDAGQVIEKTIEKSRQPNAISTVRQDLESWDTFLRARTVFFANAPPPIQQIGKGRFALDQQLFLFDHASRTLDEYWNQARRGDNPRFFDGAANRLLASRLDNPIFFDLGVNLDRVDLKQRLDACLAAASMPSTLRPEPTKEFATGRLLKHIAGEDIDFQLERPTAVPNGFAAIALVHGDEAKVVSLDQTNPLGFKMVVPEETPQEDSSVAATLFFRGLRRVGAMPLKVLGEGMRTEFELPQYDAPTVRVSRRRTEPDRLLLVFDCSRSMRSETRGGQSRLAVAQNAVIEFLDGLEQDVEVGLILFGDRYGFEMKRGVDKTTGQPQWQVVTERRNGERFLKVRQLVNGQETSAGAIRPNDDVDHNPNFDVHVAVPINPLDASQLKDIKHDIERVGAMGVTPTYLALKEAYQHMGNRKGNIILLTDGEPMVVSGDTVVNDSLDDARSMYLDRQKDVRLTIVNYVNANKQLQNQFTGVDVMNAADGKALLTRLKTIRSKPTIVWERNYEVASSEAGFEQLVRIAQWPPAGVTTSAGQPVLPAQSFSIRAKVPDSRSSIDESTSVTVEGGEQFELLLDGRDLSHLPFDYRRTQMQQIGTELTDASRFMVAAGPMSQRRNRQLVMQIAIERASGRKASGEFTPRPSDIWVEITGIDSRQAGRGSQSTYYFYLPEYQVRRPIPILLCRIDGFPEQFDRAEVKAWMRFGQERLPGASLVTDSPDPITVGDLKGVSFVTERVVDPNGGIRVVITEQYSDGRSPGSIRVLPNPLPDTASTVLYPDKNVIERTFRFKNADTQPALSVTDVNEIQKKSTLYAEGTVRIDFDSI